MSEPTTLRFQQRTSVPAMERCRFASPCGPGGIHRARRSNGRGM